MKALLSLYLPTFPCDLVRRRQKLPAGHFILLSSKDHQREVVAARCVNAGRAGVQIGMTLSHARALTPAARMHVEALDVAATARRLKALANWCLRFVPTVALDEPDGLILDASGCERIYKGLSPLLSQLAEGLRNLKIVHRLAVAPTWGAAWALARFGTKPIESVVMDNLLARLSGFPPAALRLDAETLEKLHEVGIERIGQVLKLSRKSLASRYGLALLTRLDQALGLAFEPLTPITWHVPIQVEQLLDGPTDRLEDLMQLIRQMLAEMCRQLLSRESGCRKLELVLIRSDLEPLTLSVRTARPTCDAKHLWKLLEPQIEKAHLGFGVEGLRLTAQFVSRLLQWQSEVWREEANRQREEALDQLVDTLEARLGPRRVLQMVPLESHRPEYVFLYREMNQVNSNGIAMMTDAERPSLLMAKLQEAQVMFLVPQGPVARIRSGGIDEPVISSIGPERISAQWWHGMGPARDYYKIQTQSGRWVWLFRDLSSGKWFVQGEWA